MVEYGKLGKLVVSVIWGGGGGGIRRRDGGLEGI